jgi:hypothetical protein
MTESQKRLYKNLSGRSNSMELLAGGQQSQSSGIGATISQIVGNPAFKAEVSLVTQVRYYSQAVVGTPAAVVPPAGQQNALPLYLFGANDYRSNFARGRAVVPGGAGYTYADMAVINVGDGRCGYFPLPHAAASVEYVSGTIFNNIAQSGDLLILIPMAGFVAGAAATTVTAEILVRCPNVPYTGLLDALGSDLITLNMIRYVVPVANVAQLANQITLIKGSLFGKTSTDTLDPQTFITPGTFQPQIADIPITLPIDKNLIAATQVLYTAVVPIQFTWTLTVSTIDKLTQG